jgi:hypothetical protein
MIANYATAIMAQRRVQIALSWNFLRKQQGLLINFFGFFYFIFSRVRIFLRAILGDFAG